MTWHEYPWQDVRPDPVNERLCTDSHDDDLDCRLEGASFLSGGDEPRDDLVVCAYNVERGLRLDEQLEAFTAAVDVPTPDILLLSEADRGCSRTGGRNVTRAYAEALGMCYVYGVEFVELPRFWGPGGGAVRSPCEHGNAIVSRFPLGNVRMIRHARSRSWNSALQRSVRVGQPRLGGRISVTADLRMGDRLLRVYVVHFESGRGGTGRTSRNAYREAQARELIDDAQNFGGPVVIGGDMNVVDYLPSLLGGAQGDPTVDALEDAGFRDVHSSLPPAVRATSDSGVVIDLIVARGLGIAEARVGEPAVWGGLSDHLPVWTRLTL